MYFPYPLTSALFSHNYSFFPHQILSLRPECLILNFHLPAQPSSFSWSNWSNSLRLSSFRMEGRPTGSTRRIGGPELRGPTTRGKRLCTKQQMGKSKRWHGVQPHTKLSLLARTTLSSPIGFPHPQPQTQTWDYSPGPIRSGVSVRPLGSIGWREREIWGIHLQNGPTAAFRGIVK